MKTRIFSTLLPILLAVFILAPLSVFAQEFVALTSLPGLKEAESSQNLSVFLNSLYKICIGAAAALAVFQIMRAGILFMTNKGSISENEQARSLIQGSVFGLILVLSPVIVFTIINPQILELKLDTGTLKSEFGGTYDGTTEDPVVTNDGSNGNLVRATYHGTKESAQAWIDAHCPLRERLEPPVPADVAEMVDYYKRYVKEGVTCPDRIRGTDACNSAGQTFRAACEAHSDKVRFFRNRDLVNQLSPFPWWDDPWQPIPGEAQDFAIKFRDVCKADGGYLHYAVDKDFNFFRVLWSDCHSDELERIGEGKWMCEEVVLICEADRKVGDGDDISRPAK